MKTEVRTISAPLTWTFQDGGSFVRSSVVGGFQAEVDKHNVRIYNRLGLVNTICAALGLKIGMNRAAYEIGKLIEMGGG